MRDRLFHRPSLLLLALILFSAGARHASAQALPLFGTWKLNALRSTLAGPPPQEILLLFVPIGADTVTGGEDTTYPDGSKTTTRYTLKVDGRDVPISGSESILAKADTISLARLDSSTFVWIYKRNGLLVLTLRGVLSANGRTLTTMSPDGQALVYEKQ